MTTLDGALIRTLFMVKVARPSHAASPANGPDDSCLGMLEQPERGETVGTLHRNGSTSKEYVCCKMIADDCVGSVNLTKCFFSPLLFMSLPPSLSALTLCLVSPLRLVFSF